MKTDKRISLYLEGELNSEDKKSFEEELKKSPELQNELNLYRKFISSVEETRNISASTDYLNNIIPEFRRKLESKKEKHFYPKIAYAFPVLVILFLIFFFVINTQKDNIILNNQNLTENNSNLNSFFDISGFSVDELIPADLSAKDKEEYNSELNSMIEKELNIASDSTKFLVADKLLDYNSIIDNISQQDADMLYKDLLNKKF
ncbi:MAG: hypothetical protein P8Z35_04765 [Ignavibacteriaceae bacterium]